jgi:hypothetical protein
VLKTLLIITSKDKLSTIKITVNKNKEFYNFNNYITKLKKINKLKTIAILNNYSVFYSFIKTNVFNLLVKPLIFIFNS